MKIGILTFQFADNYGAMLQAYALKKHISQNTEFSVKIINYVSDEFKDRYSISPFSSRVHGIKPFLNAVIKYPIKCCQRHKFQKFRRNKLEISSQEHSTLTDADFDKFIVGSDQVWNTDITFNDYNYFLANVSDNAGKYAYAASAHNAFLHDVQREKCLLHLEKFNEISVREIQMQSVIQENLKRDIQLVCDPVFLQSREFWESESVQPKRIPEKYILLYSLRKNMALEHIAEKLSKEKGIPVIQIHPMVQKISHVGKLQYDVGPEEFLGLIRRADCIVSNSFHAFAFSCIFSKQIYFEMLPETSNRILSLINMLDIQVEKYHSAYSADLHVYGSERYNKIKKSSENYLNQICLNGDNYEIEK